MRAYLDLCCLKRPFDRQDSERVRLETEVPMGFFRAEGPSLGLVRSRAHLLENSLNPLAWRRDAGVNP